MIRFFDKKIKLILISLLSLLLILTGCYCGLNVRKTSAKSYQRDINGDELFTETYITGLNDLDNCVRTLSYYYLDGLTVQFRCDELITEGISQDCFGFGISTNRVFSPKRESANNSQFCVSVWNRLWDQVRVSFCRDYLADNISGRSTQAGFPNPDLTGALYGYDSNVNEYVLSVASSYHFKMVFHYVENNLWYLDTYIYPFNSTYYSLFPNSSRVYFTLNQCDNILSKVALCFYGEVGSSSPAENMNVYYTIDEDLSNIIDIYRTSLSDKDNYISSLNSQITSLQNQISVLNMSIGEKDILINQLESDKSSLQSQLTQKNSEYGYVSSLLSLANQDIEDLEEMISSLNSDIDELEADYGIQIDLYVELCQDYNFVCEEKRQLLLQTDSLNSQILEKTNLISDLEDEISSLSSSAEDYEEEIAELNLQITSLQNQISSLSASVLSKETEISQLNDEIDSLESSISEKEVLITSLNGQITSLQNQISSLSASVLSKETEIEELNSELEIVESTVANLDSQIISLNSQIDDLEEDKDGMQSLIDSKVLTINSLNAQILEINLQIEEINSEITSLESKYHNKLSAIEKSNSERSIKQIFSIFIGIVVFLIMFIVILTLSSKLRKQKRYKRK